MALDALVPHAHVFHNNRMRDMVKMSSPAHNTGSSCATRLPMTTCKLIIQYMLQCVTCGDIRCVPNYLHPHAISVSHFMSTTHTRSMHLEATQFPRGSWDPASCFMLSKVLDLAGPRNVVCLREVNACGLQPTSSDSGL